MRNDSTPADGPSFGHRLHSSTGRGSTTVASDDQAPPEVPGLRVGRLLGRGGSSAAWLVTDDDGRRFALKVAGTPSSGSRTPARSVAPAAPTRTAPTSTAGSRGRRAARQEVDSVHTGPTADSLDEGDGQGHASTSSGTDITNDDLERELRLLQCFRHEHLLRVHRMVGTSQGPGMLAELAPGGSLLELVTSRGPLPIPEVVTALAPIAQVLSYLHGAGAVHGDVTPGNILFTSEGKPLLGDFGTGRLLGAQSGVPAGTPGFLDPMSAGDYDVGEDVFTLAAVCWFALTGRVPGPTEQRPPLVLIVPEVSPALMELIEDGLSETRNRRPTADDFARTLLATATPTPVNLVPAVHPSVLPELLTQRAPRPSGTSGPARRLRPTRRGRKPATPGASAADRSRTRATGARGSRSAVSDPPVRNAVGADDGHRIRGTLALLGGVVAAVLLVAGAALTLSGGDEPAGIDSVATGEVASERALDEPAREPDAAGRGAGGAAVGDEPVGNAAVGDETTGSTVPSSGAAPGDAVPGGSTNGEASAADGGPGSEAPGEDPPLAAQEADPVQALAGLATLRATAFREADATLLRAVDVEGSPAMRADLQAVNALEDSGRTLQDLAITLRDPRLLLSPDLADLPAMGALPAVAEPPADTEVSLVRATAAMSSYTEWPGSSGERPPLMAAGQQELIFILWDSGAGWRIHTVVLPPA